MREVTQNDLSIRRLILGELKGVEREELEERFLTDADFREKVLMAEDDLIDAFLEGELDGSDLEEFQSVFQSTQQHPSKLRAARSIHRYAKREFVAADLQPAARRRNWFLYVTVAATVLVIVLASLWLFSRTQENQRLADERSRQMDFERQLVAANAQPAGSSEATVSLVLVPVATRSSSNQPRLSFGEGAEDFDLWLVPTTTEHENFSGSLRRLASHEQFAIPGLRLARRGEARMVRLRLPAKLLAHGEYEIVLQALGPAGQVVDAGTFTFQVTD